MEQHTNKIVDYLYEEYKYVEFDEDNSIEENIKNFKESIYFSVMMLKHKGNEHLAIDEMLKLFYGKIPTKRERQKEQFIKVKKQLYEYFYYNQYDEERYPHFRACDQYPDETGSEYSYMFYD
jgi:ribosomal protein S21